MSPAVWLVLDQLVYLHNAEFGLRIAEFFGYWMLDGMSANHPMMGEAPMTPQANDAAGQ